MLPARLDLVPDVAAFELLHASWTSEGVLPNGTALVEGGLKRLWLDRPASPTLYANQLGGFRVRCPVDGGAVAGAFGNALQGWRRGGPFSMPCPSCQADHALDLVHLAPPGGFASGAVVFADVGSATLRSGVLGALEAVVGPAPRVVLRRAV